MIPGRFGNNSHPQFELIRELNRGGMGVIYEARDRSLNRRVALKLLIGQSIDERDVLRFEREAQAIAKLRHPNIVGVQHFGFEGSQPFMVMDFVDGEDLQSTIEQHLKTNGEVPEFSWTQKTFLKIAETLVCCHEQGIIHRDFKPSNVMISKENGQPILIDFGLVKREALLDENNVAGPRLSATGEILGTPSYMSPEQIDARSADISTPADIWAFGIALFYCLTGTLPFQNASNVAILLAILKNEVPAPKSLNDKVPEWLNQLCLECLHKSPDKRLSSADLYQRLKTGEVRVSPNRTKTTLIFGMIIVMLLFSVAGFQWLNSELRLESLVPIPPISSEESITIEGKVNQANAVLKLAKKVVVADGDGAFKIPILLSQGENTLQLRSKVDNDWIALGSPIEVLWDSSEPVPVWKESNSFVFLETDGSIDLAVDDVSEVSIALNGETVAVSKESKRSQRLKVPVSQQSQCEVRLTDQAENTISRSVRFISVEKRRSLLQSLEDRVKWNMLRIEDQDIVIAAVDVWLGDEIRWEKTNDYSAGGTQHRIGQYKHVRSGIELHLIPGGSFTMGLQKKLIGQVCEQNEGDLPSKEITAFYYSKGKRIPEILRRELPVREVNVKPLLMAAFECSVDQWIRLGGKSRGRGLNKPVAGVTFNQINRLLEKTEGLLRLPSEAEWEYAYRAGTTTNYYWGDKRNLRQAWFRKNSNGTAQSISRHKGAQNSFGLADMSGNVWEMCADYFHLNHQGAPRDERARGRSRSAKYRDSIVTKGGGFLGRSGQGRASRRGHFKKGQSRLNVGFRAACNLPKLD